MTTTRTPDARPDDLPTLLVSPPWLRKRARPTVIAVDAVHRPTQLAWLPGEQQAWAGVVAEHHGDENALRQRIERAAQARQYRLITLLANAPEHLARPYLNRLNLIQDNNRVSGFTISESGYMQAQLDDNRKLLGRFGSDVLEFTVVAALGQPWGGAPLWTPIDGADVTAMMVGWLDGSHGGFARAWLIRHSATAALDLVPAAVGSSVTPRRQAEFVLRMLDARGHRDAVIAAAASYGDPVAAAITAMLDDDPLLRLPTRIPKVPDWLKPGSLPRIRLRDRDLVLPPSATAHLLTMLMMCGPDKDYAGVRVVAAATDPASTAEFAWALFRAWEAARYPAKRNQWPLRALGLLGNDETALRLRKLAEQRQPVNVALGAVEMLALIGTDNAVAQTQLVAENAKTPHARYAARAMIREIARSRGLTEEEFADRAVPDLGLSAHGTLTLDYGPRRFVIGLDEHLKPVVTDEHGTPGATLPKPGKTDDPVRAAAAYASFGAFTKALAAAITDQSARLESAMVARRRWTAADQRHLFIAHPVLSQLARRLVWATFDVDGDVTGTFRVDNDGTLTDSSDELVELPDTIAVGIAHPLHLDASIARWRELFADYQIVQPFPQLGRPSFGPAAPEVAAGLDRYRGTTVPTGKILRLLTLGWFRGYSADGAADRFTRTLACGRAAQLDVFPGIDGRDPMIEPEQTVTSIQLSAATTLASLEPIVASELLRELETLS